MEKMSSDELMHTHLQKSVIFSCLHLLRRVQTKVCRPAYKMSETRDWRLRKSMLGVQHLTSPLFLYMCGRWCVCVCVWICGPSTLQEHNDGSKHRDEPGPHWQQSPGYHARCVCVRVHADCPLQSSESSWVSISKDHFPFHPSSILSKMNSLAATLLLLLGANFLNRSVWWKIQFDSHTIACYYHKVTRAPYGKA